MKIKKIVTYAFFSALSVILSQFSLHILFSPIPINLALLSVFICSGIIDAYGSVISQLIFILLGAIGLPVYANFSGGIGILFGPSGGFLFSYPLIGAIVGTITKKFGSKFYTLILSMLLGLLVCYSLGTLWFSYITNTSIVNSIVLCVAPFLCFDIVKIIISSVLIIKLRDKIKYDIS